jgi:hypothetical protein
LARLSEPEGKAQLLSDILNTFHSNNWVDNDDFSVKLTSRIVSEKAASENQIRAAFDSIRTNFFRENKIAKERVAKVLSNALGKDLPRYVYSSSDRMSIGEIFPEISGTSDRDAESRLPDFQKDEQTLQDNFREIFRRKGASLPKRTRDSPQEVADIEQFVLKIAGRNVTFAVVVKGYKSIKKSKLRWEDIAYQITRARLADPDHILLISAKEPVDGLITNVEKYNIDISRPGCVIFIPPLDMTRILVSNQF